MSGPIPNVIKHLGYYHRWWEEDSPADSEAFYQPYERYGIDLSQRHTPRKNGKWVHGNYWWNRKEEARRWASDVQVFRPGPGGIAYTGKFVTSHYVNHTAPDWVDDDWFKEAVTNAAFEQGSEAWNRLRPAKPDFSLANSVLELKDPMGNIRDRIEDCQKKVRRATRRKSELSRAGEWYLAINFGWIPILNDTRAFVQAQRTKQKSLSQLIKDEGKPVRRRASLPNNMGSYWDESHGTFTPHRGTPYNPSMWPTLVTQCYGGGEAYQEQRYSTERKSWCEGQMRYILPPGPRDVVWTRMMLRRIMGWRATPSMVYNAMPWTWLADYFTGLGDFVGAISDGVEDRLIADYAYIMTSFEWKNTTEAVQFVQVGPEWGDTGKCTATLESKYTVKSRFPASPFGFGIKHLDQLNPKQLSILGALGLSRLP